MSRKLVGGEAAVVLIVHVDNLLVSTKKKTEIEKFVRS